MTDFSSTSLRIVPPVQAGQYNPKCAADFPPGTPLYQTASSEEVGLVDKARANATGTASVAGLAAGVGNTGDNCHTQFAGPLTLTTAQWDAVTGGSGGLTPGAPYYLSAATAGRITATAPSAGGQFVTQVGIAMSARTMLVQIGPQTAAGG